MNFPLKISKLEIYIGSYYAAAATTQEICCIMIVLSYISYKHVVGMHEWKGWQDNQDDYAIL